MMLAWLLNREATHAQANLGFRLFLKLMGLNGEYAETPYGVVREMSGMESRIDVEVATRASSSSTLKTKSIQTRASDEGEPRLKESGGICCVEQVTWKLKANVHGFFLTLDRHAPASPEFHAISWQQIADVLDDFSTMSKADQVSLFAAHYARALRRMSFETDSNL